VRAYLSGGYVDGGDYIGRVSVEAADASRDRAAHQVLLNVQVRNRRRRRLEHLLNYVSRDHRVTDDRLTTTFHPDNTTTLNVLRLTTSTGPIANLTGPYFQPSLSVCLSVCLCVSDRYFYPSMLTDYDKTWSQGPYSDLVWPRP